MRMEKQEAAAKSNKNKILMSFLPKAVSFQNPSFSPAREARPDIITSHKLRAHNSRKGFSGPMIPAAARQRPDSEQEPTSPKVSCMGQIKHKKNRIIICKKKPDETRELKKKPSGIKKIFVGAGRKADNKESIGCGKPPITDRAPSLSQMRRFASGRESTLADFDYYYATDHSQDRGFCSEGYSDDGDDDVVIPFSAPILLAGARGGSLRLEPRKEINLWKRRTMAQPQPLQLSLIN